MKKTLLSQVKCIFILITLLQSVNGLAQQNKYDIKNPGKDLHSKCKRCLETLAKKPGEVQFGSVITTDDEIIFFITDPAWFHLIFKNKNDGIVVDIVSKDQFPCGAKNKINTSNALSIGALQPPLYLKDLKNNSFVNGDGNLIIRLGLVPQELRGKEIESNFILIQDNYACHYQKLINVQTKAWDLLDMGMYMDTLVYQENLNGLGDSLKHVFKFDKRMKFVVPFGKNKYEYSREDISPIYDSLNLTDFNIREISIKAYSSVEGNTEKNIELQQKRAQSIVDALQTYQMSTIKTNIVASENWVEFFSEVSSSSHAYLMKLNKEEIKEKLKDKKVNSDLEPILSKHRKAVIVIELDKKNELKSLSEEKLIGIFQQSLEDKNLKRANDIQNAVFSRILHEESPDSLSRRLEIPRHAEYGQLLLNRATFHAFRDPDLYTSYLEMQELEDLMPKNGKIKYNLCVLQFKLIMQGREEITMEEMRKSIDALKSYGIGQKLIDRMNINYNIILCEVYMFQKNYPAKDNCLKYIQSNYYKIPLTDADRVSLALYLSQYSKFDWAIKVVEPKVSKIDAEEDLVFYYLNLTLNNTKIINSASYKIVVLNAANANKKRFCKIFDAPMADGISFQLLENEGLKKVYCEQCQAE